MGHSPSYYKDFLSRFIKDELSAEEISALYAIIKDDPEAYEAIMNDQDIVALAESQSIFYQGSLSAETKDKLKRHIFLHIKHDNLGVHYVQRQSEIIHRWYWVAASVILLLGLGIYFYNSPGKQAPATAINMPKDIPAPSTNRAVITLADGSRVFLDSAGNGRLAQLGNINLVKLSNGQIAYQYADGTVSSSLGEGRGEIAYNSLTNPRGSKIIDMVLSDGSHVWLNAGSSITYPVAFVGDERKVELQGEGYFEISHAPNKKFIVWAGGVKVEVLGTHFNVNAYNESAVTKITLLEGSVKTGNNTESVIIKPGQQAQAQAQDKITVVRADLDQVMGWNNGMFYLNNQSIGEVMQQISTWYNIEIVYPSGVPDVELYGKMGRDLSLYQVLKGLQKVGLQCKLENHKLIIN